ncbi:beta-L-arabinofuranosidase domain-containing protein [Mesobacillus foraminis]|uniref:beta-L-arabinofuranosidase domain-containing protein n=1 Tax=Mesobacillus foraminis TaxID=279826 RepID=UPI00288C3E50|nr:beta-L-arabinofuranosidase domain-containing protein [Mesobacillus foraminis]
MKVDTTVLVPDTLLLEERARQVLNCIIGMADEDLNGIPFFNADFVSSPPHMTHGDWDFGSSHGRLIDAVTLARHMTGETFGGDVEQQYKANLLSFFKEDGLSYRRLNPFVKEISANLIDQRAVILSLTSWYMETKDLEVKEAADKHCAALKRIAIKEKDVWYYPASEYKEDGWPSQNAVQIRLAPDPASFCGRLIMPLLKYHEVTGNQDAFELCEFFTQLIIERSGVYNKDGSFNSSLAYRSGHFHTRIGTLDALARYALFTGDASITQFVKKSYDWALTQCTAYGWTPGDMQEQAYEHETCSLVDLISCGIALARSGYVEYWGVVEKFLRNHLTESQLLDLDWVEKWNDKSMDEPGYKTYYKVAERTRGAFAGYSAPNDFCCDVNHGRGHTSDLQLCCIGSGTRGLFMGWSNIITNKGGTVRINLLLSRGSKLLDINSHLPHEGRLDLIIHEDIENLEIRIPDWAGYNKVLVERAFNNEKIIQTGKDSSSWIKKRYYRIGKAQKGEKITVTFPLSEYKTTEKALGQEFEVKWRGDDVIHISPEGQYKPLYNQRKVFDKAPLKEVHYHRVTEELYW